MQNGRSSGPHRYCIAETQLQVAVSRHHLERIREERAVTHAILDRSAAIVFDSALLLTAGSGRAMLGSFGPTPK